jgi:hypothetical protein
VKNIIVSVALMWCAGLAFAEDCNCSSYPFKPNPPCFSHCVASLSAKIPTESGKVKNIDPGVSIGIRVLSETMDRTSIDFKSIKGKKDLERAAWESMMAVDSLKLKKSAE